MVCWTRTARLDAGNTGEDLPGPVDRLIAERVLGFGEGALHDTLKITR